MPPESPTLGLTHLQFEAILVPLPPSVSRAVDRAALERTTGALLLNGRGTRSGRHAPTRRLRRLGAVAGVRLPGMHPHMLRHTFVTMMLDAGVAPGTCRSPPGMPTLGTTMRYDRARKDLDRHPNHMLAAYMASGT